MFPQKRIKYLTYSGILKIARRLRRLYPENLIEVMNKSAIYLALETTMREAEKIKRFKVKVVRNASRLFYELIMLHPFIDRNERAATAALILFLRNNGYKVRRSYKNRTK